MFRAVGLTGILFFSLSLNAGEVLRLKVGNIKPSNENRKAFESQGPRFLPKPYRVYYILQFKEAVLPEWKTQLSQAGVSFGSYLPDDAFIVKIDSARAWRELNRSHFVNSVIPYKSTYRISPDFESSAEVAQKVIVRLTSEDEFQNFLRTLKARQIKFILHQASEKRLIIEALPANIRALAEIEGVEWIEPHFDMQTFDLDLNGEGESPVPPGYASLTGYESGTKLINVDPAYDRGLNGLGEIVGLADTGVDRGSAIDIMDDLKDQVINGYRLGMFSKGWEDPLGHGTHLTGSIVGTGATSGGKLRGAAFGAQLVIQSLWSPLAKDITMHPDFRRLFGMVYEKDLVRIHSNSWGHGRRLGEYDSYAAMLDEVIWKYPDLLVLFAPGNLGNDADENGVIDEGSITSPSTAKNCLTVGASKNFVLTGGLQVPLKRLSGPDRQWMVEPLASSRLSDNPMGLAPFSGRGPTKDGRIKPEIVAPGTNIISTRSQHPKAGTMWAAFNRFYAYGGGTSMATPLVAGAAAIVRQYLRSLGVQKPSAALLKAVLLHSAFDLFPGQFGLGPAQELLTRRPNFQEGFGRVDVGNAISLSSRDFFDEPRGLVTAESRTYPVPIKMGQQLHATLVYTDAPGSAGAQTALVNDLDLTVFENSEAIYPNHGKAPDSINNSETIEYRASQDGIIYVLVKGRNVPTPNPLGGQPYALVVTVQ